MSQVQEQVKENEQSMAMPTQSAPSNNAVNTQTENRQPSNTDDYAQLLNAGFSHQEIQDYMRPQLVEAGFADQEINAYFNKFQIADGTVDASPKATLMQYFKHGFEGSVLGLAWNEKLPDSVTEGQLQNADWMDRFALGVGQMLGDSFTLTVGGALGAAAGTPAGPAGTMAGMMGGGAALTEGMRRLYTERIAAGNVQDFDYLQAFFNVLSDAAKGFNTGALAGIAGGAAGAALTKAGAGVATQITGSAAAEVGTMVSAQAAQERRLPHPQEFVDAALFVTAMRVAGAGLKQAHNVAADITPKMREIYAKVGKTPEEVAQAAQEDPTVKQDLLSVNRDVPEVLWKDVLERLKDGKNVADEELEAFKEHAWAQAELNERANPNNVKENLAQLFNDAVNKKNLNQRVSWGFIRKEEAEKLTQQTGVNVIEGYSHTILASDVKHAINKHGSATEIKRGQIPITADDISLIPEIVRDKNTIITGSQTDQKLPAVVYEATTNGGYTIYIEEVHTKRNQLAFKDMWKLKRPPKGGQKFPGPNVQNEQGYYPGGPNATSAQIKPAELTSETTAAETTTLDAASTDNIISAPKSVNEGSSIQVPTAESLVEKNTDQRLSTGGSTEVPIDPNKPVVPANGKLRHEDAVALSSVVEDLATALDTPIRVGKLGNVGKGVLGIFKEKPEVIRTKVANDITTVVHEAGHAIQKALFGQIDDTPLQPFATELLPMATTPGKGQSALPEGFAEFVAKYVCNPEEAKQMAPQFYAHFEQLLQSKSPEFSNALLNAREVVRKWAEQPHAQEVLSHINIEGRENEGMLARMLSRDTWERLYTNFVDRLYPLKKATEYLADGRELPAEVNPYTLARTFAGAKGKVTHFLEHSPFKYGTWKNVGKPLAQTLRAVENLDEFRSFLVSRRGLELEARGINSGVRKEAMEATVQQFEGKYGALAKELDEYQDHLVNYLVDSGVMSKESAQAMRDLNKSYVPFYRVMEKEEGFLGGAKNFAARNPIRRIHGSGRDIIDPLESIIKNTYAIIEAAEKNAVGKALTNLAETKEGSGWLIEKLPTPKTAVRISSEQVNKAFMESLLRN